MAQIRRYCCFIRDFFALERAVVCFLASESWFLTDLICDAFMIYENPLPGSCDISVKVVRIHFSLLSFKNYFTALDKIVLGNA